MEENTVELFDYLRVIWKRKILIIVVTLVCIGVGVGVTNSKQKPKLPVKYSAEMVIKIGKKVNLAPFTGVASSVDYIEGPENLVTIIPLKYWPKIKDASKYHLEVKQVGSLGMLRITLKGPDRRVERGLKELVDMLIDEHRVLAESSIIAYKNLIKKLKKDAEMLKGEIAVIAAGIKEMKKKEAKYLVDIDAIRGKEQIGGDRSAFLNMLYLKTLDKERDLSRNRANLRNTQWQLILYKTTIGSLVDFDTKMLGEVNNAVMKPKKRKSPISFITVAGVAGLIMSLFIAFFTEYIEESKLRRKGKLQG